jgi:hypothetical protein
MLTGDILLKNLIQNSKVEIFLGELKPLGSEKA